MIVDWDELLKFGTEKWLSIASAIGAITAFWVKFMRPALKFGFRTFEIIGKLDTIISELTPNGGGSMRDQINRIETNQCKNEERARILMLDHEDGVWESDINGLCIWANRTLLRFADLDLAEIQGNGWYVAIPEDERNRVITEWQRAVKDQRPFRLEYPLQTREGKLTHVKAEGNPMWKNRKVIGWVGTLKRIA